ncbi:MAG TPA: alanine dehydrogenase [Blastocatellia bacterium]|jgi:alanine dehydrogenase|nr:alanine dehydrogenase [Blastocatellia bacterium]
MIVGLPKEVKDNEYRVGIVPAGVKALTNAGHSVVVQKGAGEGSGISDEEYVRAGGEVVDSADEAWSRADMVVKVKEPIASEYRFLREDLILFTYLHLAPARELTKAMLDSGVTGVAYETITNDLGHLPLLTPMSEVAGRMAIQVGATYLEKINGGRGVLLGGVPGVLPGRVTIIGGGVVGTNAAKIAVGFGASVIIIDRDLERLRYLDDIFGSRIRTLASNPYTIAESVAASDLVVGAVLVPGAAAPKLVTREMLRAMPRGAVIVDVAVDQGGCIETTKPTTHSQPTYYVENVLHYGVTNMPGAVPRTSTFGLTNVTLPFALKLAGHGVVEAIQKDPHLKAGVNTYKGKAVYKAVAQDQGLEFTPIDQFL